MTQRWSLSPGHVPDVLELVLLAIAVSIALYEAWVSWRRPRVRMPPPAGGVVLTLRVGALLALLLVAFEVGLVVESVSPTGRRLVVLLDTSASMSLADANSPSDEPTTRHRRARQLWQDSDTARAAWREAGLALEVHAFDTQTRSLGADPSEALTETPAGQGSDLARSLASDLQEEGERRPLAGVVVISDGLVADDEAEAEHVLAVGQALGAPITTAAVGAPQIRDVSVAEVRAGEFAFVENVVEFEASIIAHGLEGTATHVELRRDGEVVARDPIVLGADGLPLAVRFEVAPDRVGQFVYEIAVPPQEREATRNNNVRPFVVKVLRDKVRVLHVAGRPDWDVRALRTLLRRDPNVELLSYYILRDFDDIDRDDGHAPLSLIQFPTDELFREELGSFDLVVLHNFDPIRHQVGRYMKFLADYVLDGGALVLIGGDLGLADADYAAKQLAALLPVDTQMPARLVQQPFRPQVTDSGRRHPITSWLSTEGWGALPELDNHNELIVAAHGPSIGATPLLVHPTATTNGGEPRPVLSVAEPGRGRTLVLGTGSTWRLGFAPDLTMVDGARPYDLLWLGAVRWLLHDESSGRLSLETDRPSYHVGDPVQLRVGALSPSYAPEPDVEVSWTVERLGPDDDTRVAGGRWKTDALGRATGTLDDLPVGAYAAVAKREIDDALDDGRPRVPEARRVFLVRHPGRELANVDADPGTDLLANLAQATHGRALIAASGDGLPADLPVADPFDDDDGQVDSRKVIPLWNGWAALVLLLIAFPGEWLLRRRHGNV